MTVNCSWQIVLSAKVFLGARTRKIHTSAVGHNYLTNYCETYYQASNINTGAREPLHITYRIHMLRYKPRGNEMKDKEMRGERRGGETFSL